MEFGALPEAFEAAKPIRSPNHCAVPFDDIGSLLFATELFTIL